MEYRITNADTDSISFCKYDGSEFSEDEITSILEDINSFLPDDILMEDDGIYDRMLISKAKNYVLLEKGKDKLKFKGSSFKDSKKEPALRKMLNELIDSLIFGKGKEVEIYEKYIEKACTIDDISEWIIKKSITKKLLESERTNESKVRDAFNGRSFREGDKIYLFNDIDGEIQLVRNGEPVFIKRTGEPKMIPNKILRLYEDYNGSYDKEHYIGRVYKTMKILENVLDLSQFERYDIKRGKKILEERGLYHE